MAGLPRIRTGRTWRDLPPSPPSVAAPIPVWHEPAETRPGAPEERRRKLWPWLAGGLVVTALGFVVGAQLGSEPAAAESAPAAADQPEEEVPAAPTETLPEEIVPPLPPDSTTPDGSLAPPSLPDDPGPDLPGLGEDVLFTLPSLPDGFTQTEAGLGVGPGGVEQRVVIESSTGEIVITGSLAPSARLPGGDSVTVRDATGVWVDASTLVWQEDPLILMEITATGDVAQEQILDVAERLEFR